MAISLNLYEDEKPLPPRRYSSGKTQVDLIEEILEALESNDVVLLRAMVGSGKSVVGIRTILELGRGVVAVPTKVLSDQYSRSYEKEKYFLRENGSRAKISVLKGRDNFHCLHMKEKGHETTCSWRNLPCRRRLNHEAGERRTDALKECREWGFVFPRNLANDVRGAKKEFYRGVGGEWAVCLHGECPYWKQFLAYPSADVIVMNSMKWAAEISIGRLPVVPLTVVDEADEWLDQLALKVTVSQKRIEWVKEKLRENEIAVDLEELWEETTAGKKDPLDLAIFLEELLEEMDETANDFFWKLASVLEYWEDVECEVKNDAVAYLVPDPRPVFLGYRRKVGGKWLLMSATVQSEEVLREVYGIDPVIVEGETKFPGLIVQRRTWREMPVNYRSWSKEEFRENYWKLLEEIVEKAGRPAFLPVHAFKYLPPRLAEKIKESDVDVVEEDGVMLTTKMDRGADLKGMKSIVVTKFPFPEREDPLLKGMEKRLGKKAFWAYYRDMAERCFIQQVGRVLRSEGDVVEFWSPDEICHRMLMKAWRGRVRKCSR
ncbi:MAG: helicase C-terminal domain-containing protein [Candidatus Hadarchaeales archaeon]